MSLSTKVTLSFIAGTLAAMIAWVIIDFNGFFVLSQGKGSVEQIVREQSFLGGIFGLLVGLALGFVNGLSTGISRLIRRDMLWGAGIGLVGGVLGLFFGQMLFGPLYRDPNAPLPNLGLGPLFFIWDVFVRALGWSLIGLILGTSQGFAIRSSKAVRHGAIGGFIGGFLGGMLFEVVPYVLPPLPEGSRAPSVIARGISMPITGGAIGLFIGLVETLMKQAWIRVVKGRNEGREYVISKDRITIGRDELSDIGLFGDRNIAPLHAVIEKQDGRYVLIDGGSPIGTVVNGQRVTTDTLRDGDVIEIGSMRLEFHEKATASKFTMPVDSVEKPPVQIPTMPGICPFCGSKKDPVTGACACTLGPSQPSQPSEAQYSDLTAAPLTESKAGIPRLTGISGSYAGQTFSLNPFGPTTIGREVGRDIRLELDTTVSRKHGRIENEGGTFIVYDEGSSNGTMVNGVRVTRQQLKPGDIVQFGAATFKFEQ
ncbi:MAG: FHA domain-containing protein [Armatimonadetes bacterium]|nr:FHA domain-containing protein [Armatimonadota bacterium]